MTDILDTKVMGSSTPEIGSIIETMRLTAQSGHVYIDCDGSALTPGLYPELEQVIPAGVCLAGQDSYYNISPNSIGGKHVLKGDISENGIVAYAGSYTSASYGGTLDSAFYLEVQDASYTPHDAGVSANGQVRVWGMVTTGGSGCWLKTTTTGQRYDQAFAFQSGQVNGYDHIESGISMVSDDGALALVLFRRAGDVKAIKLTGAMNSVTATTSLAAGVTHMYSKAHTADLQTFAIICYAGFVVSTDAGATMEYKQTLPSDKQHYGIFMNAAGTKLFLTNADGNVWESTDLASTWQRSNLKRQMLGFVNIAWITGTNTTNGDIYVIGNAFRDNGNNARFADVILAYSNDNGATWVYSFSVEPRQMVGTRSLLKIINNATSLIYTTSESSGINHLSEIPLINGRVAPLVIGKKIVADAI